MKRKSLIISAFLGIFMLMGCEEISLLYPMGKDDGISPQPVKNVTVRNFAGGATVKYELPNDKDLAYITAKYTISNGLEKEVTASAYVDSLVIEGFGAAGEYSIELVSYDKFQNASEPVSVKINPLESPIYNVYETMKCMIDFGGCTIKFDNPTKAEIGIFITTRDSLTNEMQFKDVYFTNRQTGSYTVRGMESKETEFGIYIQDYWGNRSEVKTLVGTPIKEVELNRKNFRTVPPRQCPGDLLPNQLMNPFRNLWNGNFTDYSHTWWPIQFPHRFTMDLGVTAKLSRLKTWMLYYPDHIWQHGTWKIFKVYGAKELPTYEEGDDIHKGWTLLGTFESIKPSGLPGGQETDEDRELRQNGEEFIFDPSLEPVRYLKFEIEKVWSSWLGSVMSEIKLFGDDSVEQPSK